MLSQGTASQVRLAELLAALSLGVDLGFGQPMEHVLRQCLIALKVAARRGLDEKECSATYFTAMLVNVGCHSDAHEQAKWFGDDIAIKAAKFRYGLRARGKAAGLRLFGAGRPALHRFRLGLEFVIAGHREMDLTVHLKVARALGEELRLASTVLQALDAAYEHWDGRGSPGKLSGEDIPLPARVAQIAEYVEVAHRMGGVQAVRSLCQSLSGTQFDPGLAKLFSAHAEELLDGLDTAHTWAAVLDAAPMLGGVLTEPELDSSLLAIANFVDLKSPYFLGHSANVADLAAAAGERLGLPAPDVQMLRRAGLVHHFGRLGVSNAIWDKREPLGAGEWERIRMHPYFTERMLQQSRALSPVGALAAQHCERLDGSGYPRGLTAGAIPLAGRILGAAVAYQAMCEPRPHRDAQSPNEVAAKLRAEARASRLDGDAVEAVLGAAGHRVKRRPEQPAGLTPREVEVLRLVAQGMSTKDVAERLSIAPKTAGNHIERIYAKIGATNRAAASLFAVQHGVFAAGFSLGEKNDLA